MGVPPLNGQSQMSPGGLDLLYERSTSPSSHLSPSSLFNLILHYSKIYWKIKKLKIAKI